MFIYYVEKRKLMQIALTILFLGIVLVLVTALVHNRIKEVSRLNLPAPLEQVKTEEKVLALTINVDWGEEFIPKVLERLDEYNVKVTFFVTGRWAAKNPELVKTISDKGHQIENHGYSHPHPDQLTVAQNKKELLETEKVILELTGKKTVFYAPPYGERGNNGLTAAEELGYTTVLWTLDTIDWRPDSTPELIAQRVLNPKIKNGIKPERKGAIVLMHPKANTVTALPEILAVLQKEEYKIVPIEKLITF